MGEAPQSRTQTIRSLSDCYAWLKRVECECRDLPDHESRKRALAGRTLSPRCQVDGSWRDSGELVRYASAYLEDLAAGRPPPSDTDLIGYHPEIAKIRARICKLADTVWPVLMVGERGTGKGHLMRAITKSTGEAPLVVALAGMPEDLADPELFGHTRVYRSRFPGQVDGLNIRPPSG